MKSGRAPRETRVDDDGVDLLERRVAAHHGVEDGDEDAGKDRGDERHEDEQLIARRTTGADGLFICCCMRAYCASVIRMPSDCIARSCRSSMALLPTSVEKNVV